MSVCVSVCVCVPVYEKEREVGRTARGRWGGGGWGGGEDVEAA